MRSNRYFIPACLLTAFSVFGQSPESQKGLPKNNEGTAENYLFPINPGHQNYLAGTMGELRRTHFHSGIDIRTDQSIGKPVRAAQDGYISRISISPFGYGNTLYITHKNGQITVYAHLHRFEKKLANYVRTEQYKARSLVANLIPQKEKWVVYQGDTVAYSGNSGSSGGPHLHFDIRNSNNEPLNPLRFDFEEIIDNLPPVALRIALQTMDADSRVNNHFGRFEFKVYKNKNQYFISKPILATGRIGIEILAYDKLNNSPFKCGINHIETQVGEQKIFNQLIEKINFSKTRNILTLINHKISYKKNKLFNKLYISDGNDLDYYNETVDKGILNIKDKKEKIRITLTDTYANRSEVVFYIQPSPILQKIRDQKYSKVAFSATESENILIVQTKKKLEKKSDSAQVFYNNTSLTIAPTYYNNNKNVFLIDMRKILPDSIKAGKETMQFHFKDMIPSGIDYPYQDKYVDIYFKNDALYDTIFLRTKYSNDKKEIFSIGSPFDPLKKNLKITLKPTIQYKENAAVYEIVGKRYRYKGGTWKENQISFFSRKFGDYTIMLDSLPPAITQIAAYSQDIRFKIKDNLSGIKTYEAHINKKWLLMKYDPKTGILQADPSDELKPLTGDFLLEVIDNAGNSSMYKNVIK